MKTFKFKNQEETKKWASAWSAQLHGGDVIALSGDLGAGKTFVSKAIGKALGVKEAITSPTYTIVQEYNAKKNDIKKMIHIDTYRLSDEQELLDIGIEDMLKDQSSLVIIEWPEKIKNILPPATKWITLEEIPGQEDGRIVTLKE